ncbi:Proline rich antigen 2 [Phytophthora cinnamomi]|uniref:Proline rich antigen 2 n=1 Tax=Phytophthora cinnamomi TaxID=4785 RepID=UPI003559E925|nr:Proline rich antigen 2 [Phytophthora cinnamomi]
MLEAAEDVVEPVCALVDVADDANALVEVAVAVNTVTEAVGVLPEAVNVLLVVVDTLPAIVGAAGAPRDPASCPPPPCDDSYLDWHVAKHDVYGEHFCTIWEAADKDHEDMDDFNLDELHDALDDAALIDE